MRDILVYANAFDSWSPGLTYAAHFAAAFDATLTGIYICPSPMTMVLSHEAPELAAYVIENIRELEECAYDARASFVSWANALGVRDAAWQVAEGDVPHTLGHAGNWHDLIVLERTAEPPLESGPVLGQIVLGTDLPCIIVPPRIADKVTLDCVALAWNGSPEAIRAIHSAWPILARAGRVVILRGTPRDAVREIGWKPEFELSDYLQRHGIHAEEKPLVTQDEGAGSALLAAAKAAGAHMLVMGAYGRTRFSEWIFGGATRHVLNHADIVVLMRH